MEEKKLLDNRVKVLKKKTISSEEALYSAIKAAPLPEKPQLNRRPSEDQFKQRRESINKLFKSHNFQD